MWILIRNNQVCERIRLDQKSRNKPGNRYPDTDNRVFGDFTMHNICPRY